MRNDAPVRIVELVYGGMAGGILAKSPAVSKNGAVKFTNTALNLGIGLPKSSTIEYLISQD